MAIPFNVPSEEHAEVALEQLILEIHQLIRMLQESRVQRNTPCVPRAQWSPRERSRDEEANERTQSNNSVDSVDAARVDLDTANSRVNGWLSTLPLTLPVTQIHLGRRESLSCELSCCEDSKISTLEEYEWKQVGVILRQIADDSKAAALKGKDSEEPSRSKENCRCESRRSLSKLLPTPIQSSILTAVICVVGWHLFRAR